MRFLTNRAPLRESVCVSPSRRGTKGEAASILLLILLLLASRSDAAGDAARGKQVFAMAGGCGCHTPENGPVGAGGGEVPTPFGKFYGTNITPDREHGIGAWSDEEVISAIRTGVARSNGVE